MGFRDVLIGLAFTVAALAAAPVQRPFTWTLGKDDAGNGSWTIDCSFQDRRCTTDFDGGVASPLQCPAGSHCTGAILPPDSRL